MVGMREIKWKQGFDSVGRVNGGHSDGFPNGDAFCPEYKILAYGWVSCLTNAFSLLEL